MSAQLAVAWTPPQRNSTPTPCCPISVADIGMVTGPNIIRHLGGLGAVETVATPTAPLGQVIADSQKALGTLRLPPGYEVKFAGLYPQLERAAINVAVAAAVALLLMLGIVTLQVEGLLVPGLRLLQMPLAFSGGAIALAASGVGLNAISLIALLTLIGVSLNHGIVLLQLVKLPALYIARRERQLRKTQ